MAIHHCVSINPYFIPIFSNKKNVKINKILNKKLPLINQLAMKIQIEKKSFFIQYAYFIKIRQSQ